MSSSTSGPYAALEWRFQVNCGVVVLEHEWARVLEPLRTQQPAEHVYDVRASSGDDGLELWSDTELLCRSGDEAVLFSRLLWHVNVSAVLASPQYVLLHAAAAEHRGRAVILSAPMESGKTTLVAGLVRAGLGYLTDEAVALRPSDGTIVGYPKALSVDRGAWEVLHDLRPAPVHHAQHLRVGQWHVPATDIRADAVCRSAAPAVIILPRYVRGAETVMTEISPGSALIEVLQQTFRLDRNRQRDMRVLAGVLAGCQTYHLQVGDLDEAVTQVLTTLRT